MFSMFFFFMFRHVYGILWFSNQTIFQIVFFHVFVFFSQIVFACGLLVF